MSERWVVLYYDGNMTRMTTLKFEVAPDGWPFTATPQHIGAQCEAITAMFPILGEQSWPVFVDNGDGVVECPSDDPPEEDYIR